MQPETNINDEWSQLKNLIRHNRDKMASVYLNEVADGKGSGEKASSVNGAKQAFENVLAAMKDLEERRV
jgi:hypothetical protein